MYRKSTEKLRIRLRPLVTCGFSSADSEIEENLPLIEAILKSFNLPSVTSKYAGPPTLHLLIVVHTGLVLLR